MENKIEGLENLGIDPDEVEKRNFTGQGNF